MSLKLKIAGVVLVAVLVCAAAQEEAAYFCAVRQLRVRLQPTATSSTIARIGFGRPVVVIDAYGDWLKVYLSDELMGWVPKRALISDQEFKKDFFSDDFVKKQQKAFERFAKKRPEYRKTEDVESIPVSGQIDSGAAIKSNINIRQEPNLQALVVGKTVKGKRYKLTARQQGWYRVNLGDGRFGWVYGPFLEEVVATFPSKPGTKLGLVQGNYAKARQGPSVEAPVLGVLKGGTRVQVGKKKGSWYKVRILADRHGWLYSGRVEVQARSAVATEVAGEMKFGYANKEAVNLRSGPGIDFEAVGKAWFGQMFEIINRKDEWCEVVAGKGKTTWIRGDLLSSKSEIRQVLGRREKTSGESVIKQVKTLRTNYKNGVIVRAGPSLEDKKVAKVFSGDTLFVTDWFGRWARVYVKGGGEGWVFSPLLKTDAVATQQKKSQALPIPTYAYQWQPEQRYRPGPKVEYDLEQRRRAKKVLADNQKRLDSLRLSLEAEEVRLRNQARERMVRREKDLQQQLEAERRKQDAALKLERQKLEQAVQSLEQKQRTLAVELKAKENEWQVKQQAWLGQQKQQIEQMRAKREQELLAEQTRLQEQKAAMQALAKELEEKNRKAQEEIARMRRSLGVCKSRRR